jgi:hypothetical protein
MIQQFLELYKLIEAKKSKFTDYNLENNFFVDVYRSQPLEPELYEYFSLPAIFVDYTMKGQGINKPRLITLNLHIVTDEMPDTSNISVQKEAGLNRFTYLLLIQEILEGCKLGNTTPLKFISEDIVDAPVVNYHTQTYDFETHLANIIPQYPEQIMGEFEALNIFGSLTNKV